MQLWALGPEASGAVAPFLATLKNEASVLRAHAARWLGQVGHGQVEVAEALANAMYSPDEVLRETIALAPDLDDDIRREAEATLA